MKALVAIIFLVALGFMVMSIHNADQANLSQSSAALKSANEEIARLQQRLRTSEQNVSALKAEVQQLRSAPEPTVSTLLQTVMEPSLSQSQGSAMKLLPSARQTSGFQIDLAMLAGFDSTSFFSESGPAGPQDLGKASIQVLQVARALDGYVSPHPALNSLLEGLATASEEMLRDDGSQQEETQRVQRNFSGILDQTIVLADRIANRPTGPTPQPGAIETPEAIEQTQQLQQMLTKIRSRAATIWHPQFFRQMSPTGVSP